MEKLYAYLLLYAIKLMPEAEFEHILDLAFLHSPDSKFLLDLEWNWPDRQKSLSLIENYWAEHFHQLKKNALQHFTIIPAYRDGSLRIKG